MVAATTIGRVVQALDVKQMEFINPVIGVRTHIMPNVMHMLDSAVNDCIDPFVLQVLASTAGEVLAQGVRSLRSSRTASASSSTASGEERFMLALSQLSNSLSGAAGAPFIGKDRRFFFSLLVIRC